MNGYQPTKKCTNCLAFNVCNKKHKNQVCKRYKACQPPPPPKSDSLAITPKGITYTPPQKQRTVLSVRDFAILYSMANEQIVRMESNAQRVYDYMFDNKFADSEMERQREIQIENNMKELQSNPCYQDLLRIREKLGELNIEVETPSVEVEEQ